jgi:hypothetical protein
MGALLLHLFTIRGILEIPVDLEVATGRIDDERASAADSQHVTIPVAHGMLKLGGPAFAQRLQQFLAVPRVYIQIVRCQPRPLHLAITIDAQAAALV